MDEAERQPLRDQIGLRQAYGPSGTTNLAADLARYGSNAVWRSVYYRGEKIGFTVS